jgi:hypothetical protein
MSAALRRLNPALAGQGRKPAEPGARSASLDGPAAVRHGVAQLLSAAKSFLDRTQHCTEGSMKLLNLLPAHRSSNPTCLGDKVRTSM